MTTKTIKARKVREGDFIPGLDNAYVIEVTDEATTPGDGYLLDGFVTVTFNDANGDEGYLTLPEDMPVTIEPGA